jgi:hypothetical protein
MGIPSSVFAVRGVVMMECGRLRIRLLPFTGRFDEYLYQAIDYQAESFLLF